LNDGEHQSTKDQQLANRYFLAFKDMQDADRYLRACAQLQEKQAEHGGSIYADHCEGLLSAAIVAYCRPFLKSYSLPFAVRSIDPEQLSCLAGSTDLHQKLMEKRNTFIAHADWSARSTKVVAIEEDGAVLRQSPMPSIWQGIEVEAFGRLIAAVGVECRNHAYKLDAAAKLQT
jgi:hypothetical protein